MTTGPGVPDPVHDPDENDEPTNPWGDPTAPPSPGGPPDPAQRRPG